MTVMNREIRFRRYLWVSVILAVVALVACGGSAGSDSQFPVDVTDQRVAVGEQVYSSNCATCHGEIQGPVALPGVPSHGEDGHTWHHADRHLFGWILDGPPLAQMMPPFRGKLSDDEVIAVLAYIKSGWADDIRDRQNQMSQLVEQQIIEDGGG
ncbi:MAG: cytochrome c [Chloroflexi bacterium]|nr:cytochrome c [Chloroflexota bacterium]MBT4073329.1 cytochrome c [Chloroflexota bacterium]MBT4514994.1 cytochrome c [Chloroflexota bacterium]MBT6681533.1 cytochrome c [Chloroflexota bacterium]